MPEEKMTQLEAERTIRDILAMLERDTGRPVVSLELCNIGTIIDARRCVKIDLGAKLGDWT